MKIVKLTQKEKCKHLRMNFKQVRSKIVRGINYEILTRIDNDGGNTCGEFLSQKTKYYTNASS